MMEGNGQFARQQPADRRGSATMASYHPSGHVRCHPLQAHVAPRVVAAPVSMPHDYEILTPSQGDMSQTFPSQPFYPPGFMIPIQPAWASPERVSSPSGPSAGQSNADRLSPMGTSYPESKVARAVPEPASLVSPMAATRISNDPPPPGREHPPVTGCSKTRLLGPLRTVQDTVTGLAEYTLDPFRPSNMEFQRRGEDEISKLLHLVVQHASWLKLQIKYEDPQQREQGAHTDAARAIRKSSLDFRWLMKHLEYNRTIYSKVVFNSSISELYIHQCCRGLRLKADLLAHKQHLQYNLQGEMEGVQKKEHRQNPTEHSKKGKCGTVTSINEFFTVAIELARKVEDSLKDNIPAIVIHRGNLQAIESTFQEFVEYRAVHQRNIAAYKKMSKSERKKTSRRVLDALMKIWEESEEGQQLIAVAFAARCNINIEELSK